MLHINYLISTLSKYSSRVERTAILSTFFYDFFFFLRCGSKHYKSHCLSGFLHQPKAASVDGRRRLNACHDKTECRNGRSEETHLK